MADIAINPVTRRVQFTGNTGTGPFAFTFNILADEDIAVYKNTTLLTLTTHYTVTTNANGTGSITLDSGQALISSDVLTIIGGRDLSRTTDFVTAGDLLASSLNEQLDSLVIMTQQLDEKVGRTIKTNPGDVYTDLELPTKDNRKGTVLGFNATSGDPEVGPTIADVSSLASITADIATLADIEDGTDATDAIQTVAGISSNVSTVAGISSNVTTVAGNTSNINAVAADATDIGTVAGSISNVNTVAGIDSNITTVAGNTTNINTVAGNNSNITTVAGVSANVTTVAGISSDVTTVAGISSDVTTVAADGTDIGTVAASIADVNTVASNIATISAKVSKSGDTMTGDLTIQGNLTVSGTTITVDSATAQTIDLGDGDRMRFGDSNDAYIEWNGTYFDARSTGRFDLLSSGNDLRLSTATNVGLIVNHTGGTPAVQLYNSGVQRLATTSTGIDINGNATFGDNDKAIFGAGSDLQIYHDGSNSYIVDSGTGDLNIRASATLRLQNASGTNYLYGTTGGQVLLYHNGIGRLETTSTGIDVTGTVTADGVQSTDGDIKVTTSSSFVGFNSQRAGVPSAGGYQLGRLNFDAYSTGTTFVSGASIQSFSDGAAWTSTSTPTYLSFQTTPSGSTSLKERIKVANNGDISFYEDTGTTPKFFWDASAERLGIGTSSPNSPLEVSNGTENHRVAFGTGEVYLMARNASSYITQEYIANQHVFTGYGDSSANEAMRIDSSGNVGIGTSSPLAILDIKNATNEHIVVSGSSSYGNNAIVAVNDSGGEVGLGLGGDTVEFYTNATERMRIDSSGRIGIGCTPQQPLHLVASDGTLALFSNGVDADLSIKTASGVALLTPSTGTLAFGTSNTERMRIDSSGRVGIGSNNPHATFDVKTSTDGRILFADNGSDPDIIAVNNANTAYANLKLEGATVQLRIAGTERMRIDSSGNLLVGTTDSTLYNNTTGGGANILSDGLTTIARETATTSDTVFVINDTGAGGSLQEFRKDGTTVGSIGTQSTQNLYIAGGSGNGSGIRMNSGAVFPCTGTGATADNGRDLGQGNVRWKDLYLSGGVYLGGTGAANKLDDYESGTYQTAITTGTSGTVTLNSSYDDLSYVKVGDIVHVQGYLSISSVSSPVGFFKISLPFTSKSGVQYRAAATLSVNLVSSNNVVDFWGIVDDNVNYIQVYMGDATGVQSDAAEQLQAGTDFRVQVTYQTA